MEIYGPKGSQKIFTVSFIFSNYFWHGSGTFQVWPPSIKFLEKYVSVCFTHRHEKGLERVAGIFIRPFQNAFLTPVFKKYSPTIFWKNLCRMGFINLLCLVGFTSENNAWSIFVEGFKTISSNPLIDVGLFELFLLVYPLVDYVIQGIFPFKLFSVLV